MDEQTRSSWWAQVKASGRESFGEIVFGMEDGTVSIFGLVAGLAYSAQSADQVLLAGATGAMAAAVSMAAGVFLDDQSRRDQERVSRARRLAALKSDAAARIQARLDRLHSAGFSAATLLALRREFEADPQRLLAFEAGAGDDETPRRQLFAHSLWMFVSDLFAGLTPALPFAFLPLEDARLASLALTLSLLVALGLARARIGQRAVLGTVLQTLGVAGAAALAGLGLSLVLS